MAPSGGLAPSVGLLRTVFFNSSVLPSGDWSLNVVPSADAGVLLLSGRRELGRGREFLGFLGQVLALALRRSRNVASVVELSAGEQALVLAVPAGPGQPAG